MALIALICPSCASPLEMAEDREFCFCQYCGTRVMQEKQLFEVSGQVSIRGIAGEASLLERAFLFIEDGDFVKADKYLERVLDINPKCAKAYIGKLLCNLKLRKTEDLGKQARFLTSYDYYNKAKQFADADEAQAYQKLNSEIIARHEANIRKREQEIAGLEAGINEKNQYLIDNKSNYNKCIAKKVLWKFLLVLSICCTVFFTIGALAVPAIAVINIPCAVWLVVMIVKNRKAKKSTEEYVGIKLQLQNDRIYLDAKQKELDLVLNSHEREGI